VEATGKRNSDLRLADRRWSGDDNKGWQLGLFPSIPLLLRAPVLHALALGALPAAASPPATSPGRRP